VARELAQVREHDVVAELAVVADMAVGHHEIAVAEPGRAAALAGAEVDRHVLADPVAVADHERGVVEILVAQVLRRTAEHRAALVEVPLADPHAAEAAADPDVHLDDGAGVDADTVDVLNNLPYRIDLR